MVQAKTDCLPRECTVQNQYEIRRTEGDVQPEWKLTVREDFDLV